jgi:hypothetical protein
VRILIEACAPIHDARPVPGKPPSAQVAALLHRYGITPMVDSGPADGRS